MFSVEYSKQTIPFLFLENIKCVKSIMYFEIDLDFDHHSYSIRSMPFRKFHFNTNFLYNHLYPVEGKGSHGNEIVHILIEFL